MLQIHRVIEIFIRQQYCFNYIYIAAKGLLKIESANCNLTN